MRQYRGGLPVFCLTILCHLFISPAKGSCQPFLGSKARLDLQGAALPHGATARLGNWPPSTGRHVKAMAFLEGQRLAVLSVSGTVQIWESSYFSHVLQQPNHTVFDCLATAAKAPWVAAGDRDGNICLWSADHAGKPPLRWPAHDTGVTALAFSADGRSLASMPASPLANAAVWDTKTGLQIGEIASHKAPLSGMFLSDDGKLVLSGDAVGNVRLGEVATGKAIRWFRPVEVEGPVQSLWLSPDGRTVAAEIQRSKESTALLFWEVATGDRLPAKWSDGLEAKALAGRYLEGAAIPDIKVFDAQAGKALYKATGRKDHVQQLAIAADGKLVAAAGAKDFQIWDVATASQLLHAPVDRHEPCLVRFLPDGKRVLTVDGGGRVQSWDAATGKLLQSFLLENARPDYGLALSPDGKVLAVRDRSGTGGQLISAQNGDKLGNWHQSEFAGEAAIEFSADGKLLAAVFRELGLAGGQANIYLFEASTGKKLHVFNTGGARLGEKVFFSPDSKFLVTSRTDNTWIWDVPAREYRQIVSNLGLAMYFLPDSRTLAFASLPDALATFNGLVTIGGNPPPRTLLMPPDNDFMALSPCGQIAVYRKALGGHDTLTLRSTANGKRLAVLTEQLGSIWSVSFSPDSKFLVTGGAESVPLVWDIQLLLRTPRPALALTPEELKSLWADLGSRKAAPVVAAMDRLAESPVSAVAWIAGHVNPVTTDFLERWVADLDSPSFAKREKAAHELLFLEEAAVQALQRVLANNPSLELRRRAELLLNKLQDSASAPSLIASWRAVTVLEHINTSAARDLLEALAKGAPEARLTRSAQDALRHLAEAPRLQN